VVDTPVTTGKPTLATDTGAMKVLSKESPWKMHSPWPRGSPNWYPDTLVHQVVWFTNTGEGLHDASWEPASDYGKGSQLGRSASHGCVHVPNAAEDFLYNWAAVGTPVIVYPGDGTAVADQLKQSTVDANGQPLTGPKGA
jgi:lipoprotein-anchoring transpeptidase ErfK/SrfK